MGATDYAWRGIDGIKIDLLADRSSYQPGDTAKLLIKTPLEGPALVTLEREKVLRSFTVDLQGSSPVIEVPLTESDDPNVFVSVMVISGASRSPYESRQPDVKLGYAELKVHNRKDALRVAISSAEPVYRPGAEVAVEAIVRDDAGHGLPHREVTLYAVDEGALSVGRLCQSGSLQFFPQTARIGRENGYQHQQGAARA